MPMPTSIRFLETAAGRGSDPTVPGTGASGVGPREARAEATGAASRKPAERCTTGRTPGQMLAFPGLATRLPKALVGGF